MSASACLMSRADGRWLIAARWAQPRIGKMEEIMGVGVQLLPRSWRLRAFGRFDLTLFARQDNVRELPATCRTRFRAATCARRIVR
jgi:hypothetical protein